MFGRIRNTALLFVICSVFLSGHIIKESIIAYEYKTSLKQEQLSSVSRMMNELADYIESKDNRGIDILSDMILRCGYVNSFSNHNKAYVYDYESSTAVLAHKIRETPKVTQPYSRASHSHQRSETAEPISFHIF